MIQFRNFAPIEYKGRRIYVRYMPSTDIFEYLIVDNNLDLYSAHIIATKPFFARLFGRPLSQGQMEAFYTRMVYMAESTIDTSMVTEDDHEEPKEE